MSEENRRTASRWGDEAKQGKRRDLTEDAAKKAGYPGALREEHGWRNGARVTKRPQ